MPRSSPRQGASQKQHQHQRSDSSEDARTGGEAFSRARGQPRRRPSYDNEADDEDFDEDYEDDDLGYDYDEEDGLIELEAPLTYGRFLASHILSLLPAFSLLLALGLSAWEAPCVLQDVGETTQDESRRICRKMASEGSSITAFALGLAGWSASFAARRAVENLVSWTAAGLRQISQGISERKSVEVREGEESGVTTKDDDEEESVFETIVVVVIRTVWLEVLRMLSILMAFSVILARLARLRARYHGHATSDTVNVDGMLSPWDLDWFDPRFAASLWVALGWATTEFVVTSTQMFDRLTLYQHAFYPPASQHDDFDVEAGRFAQVENSAVSIESEEEGNHKPNSPTKPSSQGATAAEMKRPDHLHGSDVEGSSSGYESGATVTARSLSRSHAKVAGNTAGNAQRPSPAERVASPSETLSKARAEARKSIVTTSYGAIGNSLPSPTAPQESKSQGEEGGGEEELVALQARLFSSLDQFLLVKKRSELEASLGTSLPDVPLVLCSLWRIDGFLWNLGSTLLLSASLTLAQGPLDSNRHPVPPDPFVPLHRIATTLGCLIVLHCTFTCFWTLTLPRLGFAVVTYTSLLGAWA